VESAILITLQPGNYTAILSGNNGTTGVGLVEVYDIIGGGLSELTNVSTRGFVGTDQKVMIGGFHAIGGNISTDAVVRGLGPTLAQFGVSGALADPVVTLVDGNGMSFRRTITGKIRSKRQFKRPDWPRRMTWNRRSLQQSRPDATPLFFRAAVVGQG
jgi:hypothetical protein